jgi:hypothetical protein
MTGGATSPQGAVRYPEPVSVAPESVNCRVNTVALCEETFLLRRGVAQKIAFAQELQSLHKNYKELLYPVSTP